MSEAKLATIRSLLAKAEATEYGPERDALNAKAYEMAARYGIEHDLMFAGHPDDLSVADRLVRVDEPYARHKAILLARLFNALGGKALINQQRPRPKKLDYSVQAYGTEADLDRAEMLFTSLLIQIARDLSSLRPDLFTTGDQLSAWRRSWLLGFIDVVTSRVAAAERSKRAETVASEGGESSSALLPVLASKRDQVEQAFQTAHPHTGSMRTGSSGRGRAAGMAAGQRADINGSRLGRRAAGVIG